MGRQQRFDRGKVMTAAELKQARIRRYLDVDGDGIPTAPIPGPTRARRLLHPRHQQGPLRKYSEEGTAYSTTCSAS